MDCEKKYNEALERARKIHNDTEFDYEKGMIEEIFPELKESEDERIRKKLISHFKGLLVESSKQECNDFLNKEFKEYIAWLEKQEERSDTNSNTENDYTKVYEWLKKNKDRYVHNRGTCGEYIPYCSDKMITDLKNYVESN